MMQIFVRSSDRTFPVQLADGATLKDLKDEIENVEFIPADIFVVVKGSMQLTDGCLEGALVSDDTVDLSMEMMGGMRNKWRKKRMRRLRRKRRKMRMRAK
jgi:small subunit ribosomal protein S27Ae